MGTSMKTDMENLCQSAPPFQIEVGIHSYSFHPIHSWLSSRYTSFQEI